MKLKNLSIGIRLGAGFAMLLILVAAMTVIGVARLQNIGGLTTAMIESDLIKERLATEWAQNISSNGIRTVSLIKNADPVQQKYFKDQILSTNARTSAIQKRLDEGIDHDAGRALFKSIMEQRVVYNALRETIFKMKIEGDEANAQTELESRLIPAMTEYNSRVEKLAAYQRENIDKGSKQIDDNFRSGRIVLITAGVLALVIGIIAAWRLSVGITRPLQHALHASAAVAAGDLSGHMTIDRGDEIGQLLQGIQNMTDSLRDTVTEVRSGANAIATASSEIASGNLDLSSRTEQQAGSLEETASAVEQLTSTVAQNANNARAANELAMSASSVAMSGREVVGQVVDTMSSINDSSKRIVDIISVIDGIAFQTNILALNAAVEAARAGEQGRGFAVVASEVRSLAQRSATAAKEIKALIDDSVRKVDTGTELVERAGKTLGEVVDSVKRVTQIVAEISVATQEQSVGISEVNNAVIQMDQVTQQNAALVEQAAAAAASLENQAARLAQVVSVFKLSDGVMMAPAAAPSIRRPSLASSPASASASARNAIATPRTRTKSQMTRVASVASATQAALPASKKAVAAAGSDEWETF